MLFGRFLIIESGWFMNNFMLNCCLVSYMVYRWLFSDPMRSRKSTTFFIGFNSDLQVVVFERCTFLLFLVVSRPTCLGVFVQVASPSSLYNPTLTSR